MATQPLAEVFGYPIDNRSDDAKRHLKDTLWSCMAARR
jgi:hypothetical protein